MQIRSLKIRPIVSIVLLIMIDSSSASQALLMEHQLYELTRTSIIRVK